MAETKKRKQTIEWSEILVTQTTRNMFKEYCKTQDTEMRVAANEILLFIVKNKIPLNSIEEMMDKNITKEVKRYHNYNAGFLQEFEKKQLELMKKLIGVVTNDGSGESKILNVFLEEILRGLQFLVFQHPNKDLASKILETNETNISKVLDDHKG